MTTAAIGGTVSRFRLPRSALLLLSIALFAAAVLYPPLHKHNIFFGPLGRPLAVAAVALLLAVALWGSRWKRVAALLATALIGQACALELIQAPTWDVYQHYLRWSELAGRPRGLFLIGVLGQTVITLGAGRGLLRPLWRAMVRLLPGPRLLLVSAFLAFAAVAPSQDLWRAVGEAVLIAWVSVVTVLNLMLVAAAVPAGALDAALTWREQHITFPPQPQTARGWDRLLPCLAAGWVVVAAAAIAWLVFQRVPHIPDDVSYLFQAKYFAAGRLFLPAPPDSSSFVVGQVMNDGTKWYGYGFPGWPVVLGGGVLAGVPWLVNPLLAGATVLLAHSLVSRLYDRVTAHSVACLLAVSPWFLFTSASFMAHPLSLVWALLALLAVDKARQQHAGRWGVVAGCSLGAMFLTRPLEGVLVGGVIGLWALGLGGSRVAPRAVAGLLGATLVLVGLGLAYNAALTGRALYAPQMKWTDAAWYPGADRLGFGRDIGNVNWPHLDPFPGHGLRDVAFNANRNFYAANFELYGWGFGSLGFAAFALALGGFRRPDRLFLAIVLVVVGGHSFYWFSGGPDFGARYWYQTLVPLTVLSVRGAQILQQRVLDGDGTELAGVRVATFVIAASLVGFINVIPWRSLGKYHRYRGMSADVGRLARARDLGHSLVFVQARDPEDYASAFIFNPRTLDAPGTIYARDAGPVHRLILERHFADRQVWLVARSPDRDGRFRVQAGPLPSGEGRR